MHRKFDLVGHELQKAMHALLLNPVGFSPYANEVTLGILVFSNYHTNFDNNKYLDWFQSLQTGSCPQIKCSIDFKIRSPTSAETDQFYCLEAPGSPRSQDRGFLGLPGSKGGHQNSQQHLAEDFQILLVTLQKTASS